MRDERFVGHLMDCKRRRLPAEKHRAVGDQKAIIDVMRTEVYLNPFVNKDCLIKKNYSNRNSTQPELRNCVGAIVEKKC